MKKWKLWLYVAILLAVIIGSPFLAIWTMNTLFALGIAYTPSTWLAAFVLLIVVGGKGKTSR